MKRTAPPFAALIIAFTMTSGLAQQKKTELPAVKSESLQILKKDKSAQIDLGQKGKKSGKVTILDDAGRQNVSMNCVTTSNGHNLKITIDNQNRNQRRCQSQCYYKDSNGYDGVLRCEGVVKGGYNGEFCSDPRSDITFTITDPGGFDCQQ
jgi:hypothetical protein